MHLIAAIFGSLLLNGGLLLQAHDAKLAPPDLTLQPGLLWFLMRRWRWILGTVGTIASALLQIYALSRLSVAVVQSISSAGILILPLYSAVYERRSIPARDLAIIGLVVAAVSIGCLTVPDQTSKLAFSIWPLFTGAFTLSLVALFVARRIRSASAMAVVAGIGMAASTLLQKVLALHDGGAFELAGTIALLVGCGAIGFLAEMSALQIAQPVKVAPTILAVSTALPIWSAPFVFGEVWPRPVVTSLALLFAVVAATHLARVARHA